MHTPIPSGAEAAWASLLERLKESIPELADEFLTRVTAIPVYTSDAVDGGELHSTAQDVLTLMVDAIVDPTTNPKVRSYAVQLGEKRAQQGIPAEALTSAVRLDFPMIWGKMMELADEELRPLLALQVERVWTVVDDYAVACSSSYISARMRAARLEVSMREEFLAALFTPEGQLPEVQRRFARVFEAPPNGPYAVVAVNGRPSTNLRESARQKFRYLYESPTHSFLFWPVRDSGVVEPYGLPEEISAEPCGLAFSPEGLAGLAAASRQAAALAEHLSPEDEKPLTIGQNWQRLVRRHTTASGFEFTRSLDAALADARPGEEERIRETVVCYLLTGSMTDTAEHLYAHRNTVLKRLRRFTELTGLDLHIPAQAAQVVVAWLG